MIRNAYRPDQMAAAAAASLAVLPIGEPSGDVYRLTPQELYELGKRHFEKKDLAGAGTYLAELLAKWNVNAEAYKEAARMLLDIHLEKGPPAEIVHYFEIIKEKWPELEFPFEKIVKVAAAYHEMGEYERSYLVFRATAESSFIREAAVGGFLEEQGEFVRSIGFMNRLLAEYPPEPYVAAADFALSQRVYAKAARAADDPKLREKKINRVDLISQALAMLDNFLTDYPDDPAADQAAFSKANGLLELKAYKKVIAQATKFAARYPASDYLDSFWYIVAYGHFALGEHEQALDMAKKVAQSKRIDKQTGREVDSPNKWEAIYIMGQVYHSLGKAAPGDRRIRAGRRSLRRRQAGDRLFHAAGNQPARGHRRSSGRACRCGTQVPQRRRGRHEAVSHRPHEVQLAEAQSRGHHADQPGGNPAVLREEARAGRWQGLSRSHAQNHVAAQGGRRLLARVPRRRFVCERTGADQSVGGRGAGRRPLGPSAHDREERAQGSLSRGGAGESDRQPQRRFRFRARPICAACSSPRECAERAP